MSGPQPPFSSDALGKSLVQYGGPIAITTGSTSGAITFGMVFPDANYQVEVELVSGSMQAYGIRAKTISSCIPVWAQATQNGAFNWRAWRLTT